MLQRNTGLSHFIREHSSAPLSEVRALIKNFWVAGPTPRAAGEWRTAEISDDLYLDHLTVGYFAAQKRFDEPQMLPLAPANVQRAYPRIGSSRAMTFHWSTDLPIQNSLGIPEPLAAHPEVAPSLLFVPTLMADTIGNRIGRGGGYYDSYLAAHPTTQTVGVLHSDYVFEDGLPTHWLQAHDVKLAALLTENKLIWCKENLK